MRLWEVVVLWLLLAACVLALLLVAGPDAFGAPAPLTRREPAQDRKWLDGWPRVYQSEDGREVVTLWSRGEMRLEIDGIAYAGRWWPEGEGDAGPIGYHCSAWGPDWWGSRCGSFDVARPRWLGWYGHRYVRVR